MPTRERWFEDFRVGEVAEAGDVEVTQEEILDFARRYDPQPFHVGPQRPRGRPLWRPDRQRLAHHRA